MRLKSLYQRVYNELKMLLLAPNSFVYAFGRCSYERICGSSVSIFCPVFLKICIAASATLSSSIFRHCSKDSYVSAEWNAVGWVNDKTWGRERQNSKLWKWLRMSQWHLVLNGTQAYTLKQFLFIYITFKCDCTSTLYLSLISKELEILFSLTIKTLN